MLGLFAHPWVQRLIQWIRGLFATSDPGCASASRSSAAQPAAAAGASVKVQTTLDPATVEVVVQVAELAGLVAEHVGEHQGNLTALNEELTAIAQGDSRAVAEVIRRLLLANQQLQQRLEQAELKLQAHQRQLQNVASAARTDSLTGLLNRRTLDDEIGRCLSDFRRRHRPAVLMMLDVDHFKRFNDEHGHVVGDVVLKHVADVLLAHCRETDVVARFGGEEFTVLLPGATVGAVLERAERTRAAVGQHPVLIEGKSLRVTASAGLAELGPQDNGLTWLARADAALYAAKHYGRNCLFWNDGEHNLPAQQVAETAAQPTGTDEQADVDLADEQFADSTFISNVARRIAEWRRGGVTFSVLLARLEAANLLAAQGGERACHEAIRLVCKSAPAYLRDMDLFTRWTRDGLAVLLPGAKAHDAVRVARRLRVGLEALHIDLDGQAFPLVLKIGIAEGIEGNDAVRVLRRAWLAMQAAGEKSSGGICIHDGVKTRPAVTPAPAAR
jgi:diguanylate cyclase